MNRAILPLLTAFGICSAERMPAQESESAIASSDVLSQISMFNYRTGPRSRLTFRGTPIAANAVGTGVVEYEDGNAQIEVEVDDLPEPATLGPYTTYILWALTPDGRALNQGVLAGYEGGKGKLETSYSASQFALIVTAEPHFAVSLPSDAITLFNVADEVEGSESKVSTLVERASYARLVPAQIDRRHPEELVQAAYSVEIARAAGAEEYASEEFARATQALADAQTALQGRRSERRETAGIARQAVLAGEDARRAALASAAEAEAEAQRQAALASERERADAALAAERDRAALALATERDRAQLALATERERADAEAARSATQAAAAAARAARADLLERLDAVLPTRETERGLLSEIGGVNFMTGAAELSVAARESLARFSGIVASYPDLRFRVAGHTDSTGSAQINTELSLRRAITVRDYLIGQGVAASAIDVDGFGPSEPIADNSTAEGRARNRRVEIIISGGPLVAE